MKAAVFVSTRNMYADIAPPVKALLANSDVERIYLLLEDDDPGVWLPPECEVINVSGQTYFRRGGPNYGSSWTWTVLLRAALHRIFPELDRIVSLDLDAFCCQDVSRLWTMDLDGYALAAVRETTALDRPELPYYNAGVMALNLDMLRRSGLGDEVMAALNRRRFAYPEQTAYTEICSGAILELPREWNAGKGTEPYGEPVIRHFMAESATFRDSEICRHWRDLPWEEVRPWK